MVYQVPDWDNRFENYKSRERDLCGFVCVPNKQHGMSFTQLIASPDGAAIYGIHCMILGALSRQKRPRKGFLTADGRPNGLPWTAADMALMWRRETVEIQRALDILCSPKIGWQRTL